MAISLAIQSSSERKQYLIISGSGVFATQTFKEGAFLLEYRGDLISLKEAKRREKMYEETEAGSLYRFKNREKCGSMYIEIYTFFAVMSLTSSYFRFFLLFQVSFFCGFQSSYYVSAIY